jgi:hypothetical protein
MSDEAMRLHFADYLLPITIYLSSPTGPKMS